MKVLLFILMLAAAVVIYFQYQKKEELTRQLAAQTERAEKLEADVSGLKIKVMDLEKALADAKKLARLPIQPMSHSLLPASVQPSAVPSSVGGGLDPNYKNPLDAPSRNR